MKTKNKLLSKLEEIKEVKNSILLLEKRYDWAVDELQDLIHLHLYSLDKDKQEHFWNLWNEMQDMNKTLSNIKRKLNIIGELNVK